jgi:hypothetical protein
MRRLLAALAVPAALLSLSVPASAQSYDSAIPIQFTSPPSQYFSAGFRSSGKISASFGNLGTITTSRVVGDTQAETTRTYDDGYVGKDTRTTGSGEDVYDDGRTNNWSYEYSGQVLSDQTGIAFHTYSSTSQGGGASADTGMNVGLDLEYAYRIGTIGAVKPGQEAPIGWGFVAGVSVNGVSAKTRGNVTATLHTIRDVYSLLGATPPAAGYVGPTNDTTTITNPDGTTTTVSVDTTTYLGNRPESRDETDLPSGAKVEGFWQVRGAYYSFRSGAWMRWQPNPRLALRISAGASMTALDTYMRYDEQLMLDSNTATDPISNKDQSDAQNDWVPGAFGSLDFEWWISRRTAFFASIGYDYYADGSDLSLGDRTASLRVESGLAIRVGVTTRF